MAEYLTLPVANLHAVPDEVTDQDACFAEPLAAACRIAEQQVGALAPPLTSIDLRVAPLMDWPLIRQTGGFLGNITLHCLTCCEICI